MGRGEFARELDELRRCIAFERFGHRAVLIAELARSGDQGPARRADTRAEHDRSEDRDTSGREQHDDEGRQIVLRNEHRARGRVRPGDHGDDRAARQNDHLRADRTATPRPQHERADGKRDHCDAGRDRGKLDCVMQAHSSHR